jgi:hypothetical protein
MATVADVTSTPASGNSTIDALLSAEGSIWNYLTPSAGNIIYFTFSDAGGPSSAVTSVIAFNPDQRAAARQALTHVEALTGIHFAETSNTAQAHWHFNSANIIDSRASGLTHTEYSYAYTSGNVITTFSANAYVYLDIFDYPATSDPAAGTWGYQVLLHEIGHALGLKHPFEGSPQLPAAVDDTNHTLMSYSWAGSYKTGYPKYDVDALWWIYGGDGLGGAYGINSTSGPTLPGVTSPPDTTPPTALAFSPADEATGVAIGADLVITFSEAIQLGAGNIVLKTSSGITLDTYDSLHGGNLTISGSTLMINPTRDLEYHTGYLVEISAGTIKDFAGNEFAGTTDYNFTTAAYVNHAPTGSVMITGTAMQGQTLVVSQTLADADGLGPLSYQWNANGTAIEGATGMSFSLTAAQVGKSITVVASYIDAHGTAEGVTSNATKTVVGRITGSQTEGPDVIIGNEQANKLSGGAGNDSLTGNAGNDTLDGGADLDIAIYSGIRSNYTLTKTNSTYTIRDTTGTDGTDSLINIERLKFSDISLALDLDNHAGEVVKIIGAVFGAASVSNELYVGMGLSLIDGGMSYEALAELAIGVAGASTNASLVELLWHNVVGTQMSAEMKTGFVDMLEGGMSRGALTALAADSSLNMDNTQLIGLYWSGLEYTPV